MPTGNYSGRGGDKEMSDASCAVQRQPRTAPGWSCIEPTLDWDLKGIEMHLDGIGV